MLTAISFLLANYDIPQLDRSAKWFAIILNRLMRPMRNNCTDKSDKIKTKS